VDPPSLGPEFAGALAAKDSSRLLDLMHPEIDFRGLTPSRSWEANDRDTVIPMLLGQWFQQDDEIEALERLETDAVADRQRVGYRFSVTNPDGRFLVSSRHTSPLGTGGSAGCACCARAYARLSHPNNALTG
jgi:hypothetical protein